MGGHIRLLAYANGRSSVLQLSRYADSVVPVLGPHTFVYAHVRAVLTLTVDRSRRTNHSRHRSH